LLPLFFWISVNAPGGLMDLSSVSGIAAASTALSQANTSQAISIAVLKKSLDINKESALALINAIPTNSPAQNLPSYLGQNINTTA
jgi:hypothetical protein